MSDDLLILRAGEVRELLAGREAELMDLVGRAYVLHGRGESSLPHSSFLRFPGDSVNRIIGLPAYLGDGLEAAGFKWIASFPGNVQRGMERASAVIVLSSCETGRPTAILEGSVISARRTAASAALAARELVGTVPPAEAGLVGAGLINREVARFLRVAFPDLRRFVIFDLAPERAAALADRLEADLPGVTAEVAESLENLLARCPLTCFATTAGEPHVDDLSRCPEGATILHVSLRDLSPEAILAADNVVDDPDHVARARTSIHLTEQRTGSLDFVRATLAEVLEGTAPPKRDPKAVTVFSPFGLGVLDLALARRVVSLAKESRVGLPVSSFLPEPSSGQD
ncbi:MAG: 2,3-diaminopropionate biosynthesis protein SbnB [Acidobacteriota bacterium]|jgi:ornithine cyclodeaminase